MTNLERDDDEFLLAIDDLQIHKGYADIMINRASHVAKRSIVIIRLQSAKQRKRLAAEQSHEAEEVCRSPKEMTTSTNERDEMIAEASTKRESEGQREGMSPAERNDLSPAEGTQEEDRARNAEGVASHRPPEKSGRGQNGGKRIAVENPTDRAPGSRDERKAISGKPASLDESRELAIAKNERKEFINEKDS